MVKIVNEDKRHFSQSLRDILEMERKIVAAVLQTCSRGAQPATDGSGEVVIVLSWDAWCLCCVVIVLSWDAWCLYCVL